MLNVVLLDISPHWDKDFELKCHHICFYWKMFMVFQVAYNRQSCEWGRVYWIWLQETQRRNQGNPWTYRIEIMTFYWIKNTTLKKSECGQALHRVGSVENVYHMRILKYECWCVSNINCLFMKNWKYYLCSIDSWRLQSWHVQACTENAFLTEIAGTKCVLIYRHCIVQWAVQPKQLTRLLTNAQHTVVARL